MQSRPIVSWHTHKKTDQTSRLAKCNLTPELSSAVVIPHLRARRSRMSAFKHEADRPGPPLWICRHRVTETQQARRSGVV